MQADMPADAAQERAPERKRHAPAALPQAVHTDHRVQMMVAGTAPEARPPERTMPPADGGRPRAESFGAGAAAAPNQTYWPAPYWPAPEGGPRARARADAALRPEVTLASVALGARSHPAGHRERDSRRRSVSNV